MTPYVLGIGLDKTKGQVLTFEIECSGESYINKKMLTKELRYFRDKAEEDRLKAESNTMRTFEIGVKSAYNALLVRLGERP